MPIVNFTINNSLERKVAKEIEKNGFQSKAEFFRFAAINFMNDLNRRVTDDDMFDYLTNRIAKAAHNKLGNKKIPPLSKQLEKI
jgi:Arc/MetJ-type ribon-helix-helix transcriptional regulator